MKTATQQCRSKNLILQNRSRCRSKAEAAEDFDKTVKIFWPFNFPTFENVACGGRRQFSLFFTAFPFFLSSLPSKKKKNREKKRKKNIKADGDKGLAWSSPIQTSVKLFFSFLRIPGNITAPKQRKNSSFYFF